MLFNTKGAGATGTIIYNGQREIEFTIPEREKKPRQSAIKIQFGFWAYYCGFTAENEVNALVSIDGGPWMTTPYYWNWTKGNHVAKFKYTPPGGIEETKTINFNTENVISSQQGPIYGVDCHFPCQTIIEPPINGQPTPPINGQPINGEPIIIDPVTGQPITTPTPISVIPIPGYTPSKVAGYGEQQYGLPQRAALEVPSWWWLVALGIGSGIVIVYYATKKKKKRKKK